MYTKFEVFFANFSFLILFLSMLLYWLQASNFQTQTVSGVTIKTQNHNIFDNIVNFFNYISTERNIGIFLTMMANSFLFLLLVLRWFESGHFPLSNLYESLMFLSWSLTFIHLLIEFLYSSKLPSNLLIAQSSSTLSLNSNANSISYYTALGETSPQNQPTILASEKKLGLEGPLVGGVQSTPLPILNISEQQNWRSSDKNGVAHIKIAEPPLIKLIGSITAPCALFTNAFATFSLPKEMQEASPLVPALQSNWLMMHVTVMILSYAALILGSLLSIGFLVITKGDNINLNLKTQSSLPSQEYKYNLARTLDNLSYRVLGFGFPLLTIGILSGAVWANEAWGSYWSWDPKETWALLTWLVFAIYLHTRLKKGWEGQKPALIASLGFITVWICFLGVNLLGEGLHSYGWLNK
jgi:cytochrome c-type biogenesis protein CcsB